MNEELLTQARDCLRIHVIALRDSRLALNPDFFPTDPGEWGLQTKIGLKSVSTGTRLDPGHKTTTKFVRGFVEAGVRLVSTVAPKQEEPQKEDGPNVGAELVATFVAEYDLEEGKNVATEAVNEFLKHNAVYHVWSFWREYVQSTFARALLPPVTLPMMVFTKPSPGQEAKPSAPESKS
jgi:hypothetical protein